MAAVALSLLLHPHPLQALRKQIMENNRYKWLLHQTRWWMQPGFPASHPFLFPFLAYSLNSPSLLHYLLLYMSLFGNRGGLEHSLAQLPYHCMAVSSVFPSWHWHYIHTDIILGKVLFLPLSLSLPLPSHPSFPSPAVVSTGTPPLLLYPPELSVHCHCKANAWDFLKQTASILYRSPICGWSMEGTISPSPPLLRSLSRTPPGIRTALGCLSQTGAMCWNNGWAASSRRGVMGSPQPAWEALSHVLLPSMLQLHKNVAEAEKPSATHLPLLPKLYAHTLTHTRTHAHKSSLCVQVYTWDLMLALGAGISTFF